MPEYQILSKDADSTIRVLRQICTGEVSPSLGLEAFQIALKEVEMLQEILEHLE